MSTLTNIEASDLITNSRADINNNFNALNSDKLETSVLDDDTTLAANSDSKVATQKAVKAYVDGGGTNASETTKGPAEEATDAEVAAGTAVGATGAKLFVTPAKLLTYVDNNLAKSAINLTTHDPFDGSTTPTPITICSDGTILQAEADGASGARLGYTGFCKSDTTEEVARYIGGSISTSSVEAPAGENRAIFVFTFHVSSAGVPTAVSWNGYNLSKIKEEVTLSTVRASVWAIAIGDSSVAQTSDVTITGGSGTYQYYHTRFYENVLQSSLTNDIDSAYTNGATSVTTPSLTKLDASSLYIYGGTSQASSVTLAKSGTENSLTADRSATGDFRRTTDDTASISWTGTNDGVVIGLVLKGVATTVPVYIGPIVNGFTGLTIASKYYVANAVGTIATSAGSTSIPVGTAISGTELLTTTIYP